MTAKLSKLASFFPNMISKLLKVFRLKNSTEYDDDSDNEDAKNNNHSRARSKTPLKDLVNGIFKSPGKIRNLVSDDDKEMEEIYANQVTVTPKAPQRSETPVQIPRAMSPVRIVNSLAP